MRAVVLPAFLVVLAVAPPAARPAPADDPLGPLKVPADHPRIGVTAAELPALRARLADPANADLARTLTARARGYLQDDPTDPSSRFGSLQSRCHGLSQQVATIAFWGLTGDDAARAEAGAWFARLQVAAIAAQLPTTDYMPRGEFLYGFPLAYDWAAAWAPPEALQRLRAIVLEHARINFAGIDQQKNWEGRTEANNHSMASMGGVGLAGLALWGEDPGAKAWAALAAAKVQSYLALSFDPDGAPYEGNLYGPFGMGMALPFAAALRHLGGTDLFGEGRLVRALHSNVGECIPGARLVMDPRNDASGQGLSANLSQYAAHACRDGLAIWALDHAEGRPWAPWEVLWPVDRTYAAEPGAEFRARFHRGRGLLDVRTGFEPGDVFAAFEAGERRGGCHGQSDQGQVTLYAGGAWLLVDPGYSNKKEEGSGNQTCAHTLVLIDGKGQVLTGGGKVVGAKMLGTHLADDVWVAARADLKPAYDADGYNPVAKAVRTFAWVTTPGRPYLVVVDEIVKDAAAHRFAARWHTGAGNTVAWDGPCATVTPPTGPTLRVHFVGPKLQGATLEEDYGSYLKGHPVLEATGQGVAWTCVQVFELVEDGVAVVAKGAGRKVTVTVTRGDLVDVLTVVPGGRAPAKLELVRKQAGRQVFKNRF